MQSGYYHDFTTDYNHHSTDYNNPADYHDYINDYDCRAICSRSSRLRG